MTFRPAHFLFLALLALMLPTAGAQSMSLPVYGNWCGPGHPENTAGVPLPPVDGLDAACMEHDRCTAALGDFNCRCDVGFMNRLKYTVYPHPAMKRTARAMYDAIAMMPCRDPMGMAYKQACVWQDLAADALSGNAAPWEMPLRWMDLGGRTLRNKSFMDGWW